MRDESASASAAHLPRGRGRCCRTAMPPKGKAEPEPEPEAEAPEEPQEGHGTFVFPDGSKYGARRRLAPTPRARAAADCSPTDRRARARRGELADAGWAEGAARARRLHQRRHRRQRLRRRVARRQDARPRHLPLREQRQVRGERSAARRARHGRAAGAPTPVRVDPGVRRAYRRRASSRTTCTPASACTPSPTARATRDRLSTRRCMAREPSQTRRCAFVGGGEGWVLDAGVGRMERCLGRPARRAAQGIPWRGQFYNGTGPGLPGCATVVAT